MEINPIIPAQDTRDVKLPTLKKGDKGEYVKVLQRMLFDCGYTFSKENGIFDEFTRLAVLQFQKDWGLNEDGIVNADTWNFLETSPEHSDTYTVTIPNISKEMAQDLSQKYVCQISPDH